MVWNVNVREFRPENEFLEVFLGLHGVCLVAGIERKREKRGNRKRRWRFGLSLGFWVSFPGLVLVLVWGNIEMRIKK